MRHWFTHAAVIAAAVWGPHPLGCQQVHHQYKQLPPYTLGEALVGDCKIIYNRRPRTGWYWGKFCTVTIHEWGHLHGYYNKHNPNDPDHSPNPRSVMYYKFTHVDRRCHD